MNKTKNVNTDSFDFTNQMVFLTVAFCYKFNLFYLYNINENLGHFMGIPSALEWLDSHVVGL